MTEPTVIDPLELRAHPELLREMREQPGKHVERRVVSLQRVEARADGDGGWKGGGLASVFDLPSHNLGGFREIVKHGAYRKVLAKNPDVRALINHDANRLLGRTTSGTLRLKELPKGLDYEFDAPATTYANDLRILMERGDLTQSSFAFRLAQGGDTWEEDPETGLLIRTIHEFEDLFDVSPVTDPAYPDATSGIRDRVQDFIAQAEAFSEEDRGRIAVAFGSNDPKRSEAQQDVRAKAQEPDEQGASDDGLATVGEPTPGGLSAAARARRLQMLAHQAG